MVLFWPHTAACAQAACTLALSRKAGDCQRCHGPWVWLAWACQRHATTHTPVSLPSGLTSVLRRVMRNTRPSQSMPLPRPWPGKTVAAFRSARHWANTVPSTVLRACSACTALRLRNKLSSPCQLSPPMTAISARAINTSTKVKPCWRRKSVPGACSACLWTAPPMGLAPCAIGILAELVEPGDEGFGISVPADHGLHPDERGLGFKHLGLDAPKRGVRRGPHGQHHAHLTLGLGAVDAALAHSR